MIKGFPAQALEVLRCPYDGGLLAFSGSVVEGVIFEGEIACSHDPSHTYPIVNGILKLLSDLGNLDPTIISEMKARDRQSGEYDGRLLHRHDKELLSTLAAIGVVDKKRVIEYGCGTGRVTKYLLTAELIVAVDLSYDSLMILFDKLGNNSNLALVQSEITSLNVCQKSFDLAVSIQVIEHIPTLDMRSKFFQSVRNALIDNGKFIFSVYHFDWRRKIKGLTQEGVHTSGIFYHYFTKSELTKELGRFFIPNVVRTIDITWPGEVKFGLHKRWGGVLSRLSEKIPVINGLGHLILVTATVKPSYIHYQWGFVSVSFFSKHWFWFDIPREVSGAAMVNFFTYQDGDHPGFHKKSGLTTVINLSPGLENIWAKFRKNFVQKQIQRGERNNIIIRHDQNFKGFKKLYLAFRRAYHLPKERLTPLQEVGEVFSAYYDNQLIAGGLFIHDGTTMRAWALASVLKTNKDLPNELVGQANRMILWNALQYAKLIGCRDFDLGGISPESENRHLRTLAEFKEAFGGDRRTNFYYYKIYSPVLRYWMKFRGFTNI